MRAILWEPFLENGTDTPHLSVVGHTPHTMRSVQHLRASSGSNQTARKGTHKSEQEAHFQGAVGADNGHHPKGTGKRAHSAAIDTAIDGGNYLTAHERMQRLLVIARPSAHLTTHAVTVVTKADSQPCRVWERVVLQAHEAVMMLSGLILLGGTARAAV